MKKQYTGIKILPRILLLLLCFLFTTGCTKKEIPLQEHEKAEEIENLLWKYRETDYISSGVLVDSIEGAIEIEGKQYAPVKIKDFSSIEELQDYFFSVYTEAYCEKRSFFEGEYAIWKQVDGQLYEIVADCPIEIMTEEEIADTVILKETKSFITIRVPGYDEEDEEDYPVDLLFQLKKTTEGLRIDERESIM